jgi:ribonuclease HII
MLICGLDEAGRGPVIGPMVMAGVLVSEEQEKLLKNLGVKDSKLILRNKRIELAKRIKNIVKKFKILIIPPDVIDKELLDENSNLNILEAKKSAEIINYLKPDIAYVDCPSNNILMYKSQIERYLTKTPKLVCEHKADIKYLASSAASILAKVTRDKEIAKIQKTIKADIGSGYPADPITRVFLRKFYNKYPKIIRKSWASYKDLIDKRNQKSLGDFS